MELGPMQNFVYLVGDPAARECVVVDPAWEIDTIVETAERDGMRLVGALVTHTHQDHVGGSLESWGMPGRIPGVEDLLERVPLKVYVHKAEREFLRGFGSDLVQVDNHDTLDIGQLTLTFMHTPGHTPGSQCFLLAHAAARGASRRDDPAPGPQLRRPVLDDRRREAPEPLHALRGARRLPAGHGRRPKPPPVGLGDPGPFCPSPCPPGTASDHALPPPRRQISDL